MIDEKLKIMTAERLKSELAQFTGTTCYLKHWTGMCYTEGIRHLARAAEAYWLVDAIASWQSHVRAIEPEFQVWELVVHENRHAELAARQDSGMEPIVSQKIEYTDFPMKSITLYVENGVLLLPSEH
jgi:hypothetical protein